MYYVIVRGIVGDLMVDTYLAAIFCKLADSEACIVLSTLFMHKDQCRLIQKHSSGKVTFPADKTELKIGFYSRIGFCINSAPKVPAQKTGNYYNNDMAPWLPSSSQTVLQAEKVTIIFNYCSISCRKNYTTHTFHARRIISCHLSSGDRCSNGATLHSSTHRGYIRDTRLHRLLQVPVNSVS